MSEINGLGNKISWNREPMNDRVERRNPAFFERLTSAVSEVNQNQHNADAAAEMVIKGEMGIHEGMRLMGRASTSLKVLAQVRNKAMSAYSEISRMQV